MHSKAFLFALAAACAAPSGTMAQTSPLYQLTHETRLASTDTDWDYSKLEPNGPRLFMARRKDGLVVYDVDAQQQKAVVQNSVGANGPLLLPQYDRGYVAMTDGSLLSFELKSLKVIDRVKLAEDGGLNGATYDPATEHVHILTGQRPANSTWFTIDARTGKLLGKKLFPFTKMDDPAADGKGHLFAAARYDNIIMKLDAGTLEERARWTVGDCIQPTAIEYQAETDRLLVACRGEKPVFIAVDPKDGRIVATVPIGKGTDGLAVDEVRHRILSSNGIDANLSVIAQDGPDSYRLLGAVMTRPMAKIMQLDPKTGRAFLVTADHTVTPPSSGNAPATAFHADSFTVLTYEPR